jgi:cobalt-zinc-cadmium efflux system outer membrane protein
MKLLNYLKIAMVCLAAAVLVAGCATTRTEPASVAVVVADSAITAEEMAAVFGEKEIGNAELEIGEMWTAVPTDPAVKTLTPEEVLRIAAEKNPGFAEYAAVREAALAEVMAAAAWQNPSLEAGVGRGKTRGDPSTSGFEYSLGLIQPVEWPGKRAIRKEAAAAGVKVAELEGALFRSTLRADVLRAYWTADGCEEEEAQGKLLKEFAEAFLRLAEAQVAAGELNEAALPPLKAEALKAEQEWLAAGMRRRLAENLLRRLCGGTLPEGERKDWHPPSCATVNQGDARELALKKHPAILKLEAEKRRRELLVKQAESAKKPDLTPGLEVSRGVDVLSWGARLGMELPFWNRNKAGIAAAKAELHRVEAQLASVRQEVAAGVDAAVLEHANAVSCMKSTFKAVGAAVKASHAARSMMAAGEIDRSTYLAVMRGSELLNREAYRAATAAILARIQLEQAIGYGELK